VVDVRVGFDPADTAVVHVDLLYSLRGVNDPRNLVFPFYVIPDHPNPLAPTVATGAGEVSTLVAQER
jgi:hypothetical protein